MEMNQLNSSYIGAEYTMSIISGKWKPLIIYHLRQGTKRYGQIKRLVPDASPKVLIQQLKELEHDGIINRKSYPEVPPKVEYSVTAKGRSLYPVLDLLWFWSHQKL
ncbi:winged helix-turn-helix transcriptional regulator [Chengkuizengella axinellae]|uniref:Helix-turn-helix domain-containing protein n=1 Tax=Chengkuizengella axinellae TaxID=3064388 RepID=A0ABT9IZH2_9BACL|nr:helix-turn-helix domain-containing protein [Chengkuizengella sp. 2205SS18-9]MDP5274618.1 helix-turn-helix domain-containing protein [Chengkuizengella sp. 2205SS18-9]